VSPTGRALPKLDPTQPARMVPFQAGANSRMTSQAADLKEGVCATLLILG
jgi:hypothetical protein